MPGLERFDTASDFMRDTTTTTHLSMCHDTVHNAECSAALEVGALCALPEPGNIVNSIEDPTYDLLDGAVQLEKHGKMAFDISIHHFVSRSRCTTRSSLTAVVSMRDVQLPLTPSKSLESHLLKYNIRLEAHEPYAVCVPEGCW